MKSKSKNLINKLPIPVQMIERRIYLIRGQKVMLDADLAELYEVENRSLIQAIKRNVERFPQDFMFQLNKDEVENLRSQIVISSWRSQIVTSNYGGRRYLPYAFTEHGVAMLSSVLRSKRAVQMNIFIIRAFIKMRQLQAANSNLEKRIDKIEDLQKLFDEVLTALIQDVKRMKDPRKTNAIGFEWKTKKFK